MASVHKRESAHGPRYRVLWRDGGRATGKTQSETFPARPAAAQFARAVDDMGQHWPPDWDRVNHRWRPKNATDNRVLTVDQWATEWLEAVSGVAERTRHDYERDLRLHVRPTFGQTCLDEITPQHVSRWVNSLERDGKAPKTIANVHGLMYQLMRDAADAGLRTGNPCARTKLPRQDNLTNEQIVWLTPGEVDLVLARVPEPAKALFVVMAATGLRWAEATALQIGDVDLLATPPTLTVHRAWKRLPSGKGRVLGPPKTRRSRRSVSLPPYVVDLLVPLVQRDSADFLLTSPEGLAWHYTPSQRTWNRAVLRAQRCDNPEHTEPCDPQKCPGVLTKRPTIKSLRHSHASALIAAGVPLPMVQRRLGHESIQTTVNTYTHLMPELDFQVTAELQRLHGAVLDPSAVP